MMAGAVARLSTFSVGRGNVAKGDKHGRVTRWVVDQRANFFLNAIFSEVGSDGAVRSRSEVLFFRHCSATMS